MGRREKKMPPMEKKKCKMRISVQLKEYKYQLHFECFTGEHWTDTTFTLSAFFSLLLLWIEIFIFLFSIRWCYFASKQSFCMLQSVHWNSHFAKRDEQKKIIQSFQWNIFLGKFFRLRQKKNSVFLVADWSCFARIAAIITMVNDTDGNIAIQNLYSIFNHIPFDFVKVLFIHFLCWLNETRSREMASERLNGFEKNVSFRRNPLIDVVVMYSKGCFICHLLQRKFKCDGDTNSQQQNVNGIFCVAS